jgi:hypothetical protein
MKGEVFSCYDLEVNCNCKDYLKTYVRAGIGFSA